MVKFVMGLCLPENSELIDISEVMSFVNSTFEQDKKDVTILDLNHINEDVLKKFVSNNGIDCFAFTPETLYSSTGKRIVANILSVDENQGQDVKLLNIYDSKDKNNIEQSVKIGDMLLDDEFNGRLTHLDMSTDQRILTQNLKGIKNDAITIRRKLQSKEQDVLGLTKSIVDTIENEKDEYTSKHIRSVSKIAEVIARKMGLDENEIDLLKIGALLHDVGKNDISDNVLKKPSRLTNEEFQEMRSHVSLGEIELNQYDLGEFERAKLIAAEHHEKYDGTGYPRGLKGDEIDRLSRIVSLADATQAMFGRNYQQGKKKNELIEELSRCAGSQFDPEMVDILCDTLDKEPEALYISYGDDGRVVYDVPDTSKMIEETRKSRASRENDFFKSLQDGINEEPTNNKPTSSERNNKQIRNIDLNK